MASDMNRIILIGRLTRDPEMRYTPSGTGVASFAIANGKTFTQNGEKKEQVSYFDCIAWSKLGELIVEYCKKGHRIAIEGRLQQRRWKDDAGNNRSAVEVVVENIQFLQGSRETQGTTPEQEPAQGTAGRVQNEFNGQSANFEENPFSDDDVPF